MKFPVCLPHSAMAAQCSSKAKRQVLTALFVSLATRLLILEGYCCHVLQRGFSAFPKQFHDFRVWSSSLLIGIVYRNRTQVESTAH